MIYLIVSFKGLYFLIESNPTTSSVLEKGNSILFQKKLTINIDDKVLKAIIVFFNNLLIKN
tara:strand:- start:398 stop:580 length:183 start_codon:yes stop_codon:yes gene_type:complete